MFNRSHEERIEIHNHNFVSPARVQDRQASQSAITGIAGLVIISTTVIVMCVIVWQVLIRLIDALVVLLSSLISMIPVLAGVAALIGLAYWLLRSLPDALDEVQEIRHKRMIASRNVLLLEHKDANYITVASNIASTRIAR